MLTNVHTAHSTTTPLILIASPGSDNYTYHVLHYSGAGCSEYQATLDYLDTFSDFTGEHSPERIRTCNRWIARRADRPLNQVVACSTKYQTSLKLIDSR